MVNRAATGHDRDQFLQTGRTPTGVRSLVADSWRRSLDSGVDPEAGHAPLELVDDALDDWRSRHPLAPTMPVVRRLLADEATDSGLLVAVSDAQGRLMWVEGHTRVRTRAERIHFVEGACWSEEQAGTNAPGTALALDRPVQIHTAEHLARPVTPWSCAAAPIHDPDTGALLGALDLTGGDDVAAPRTLSLVRATVAAVEAELRVRRLQGLDSAPESAAGPVLRVLDRRAGVLETAGPVPLGLRHSEILVLLAAHPRGLSGEQLAVLLHERDQAPVTLRAELSRLRAMLAPLPLLSRPYRLGEPLVTDAEQVRQLVGRGAVAEAVDVYAGPLLPTSTAPGVVELRESLHARLRAAVLGTRDAGLLLRFADTHHGRDDYELWHDVAATLPAGSARSQALAHLHRLDADLA